jgi:hypothetical protein
MKPFLTISLFCLPFIAPHSQSFHSGRVYVWCTDAIAWNSPRKPLWPLSSKPRTHVSCDVFVFWAPYFLCRIGHSFDCSRLPPWII